MITKHEHGYETITGDEAPIGDGAALDALIAFYRAFNSGDLTGMAAVWASGDEPSMDNPVGGIRRGWPEIRDGYVGLFGGRAKVRVALHDFTIHEGEDWCLFVGREQGACTFPEGKIDLRIRTSRWFRRISGEWRQYHHHGSIDDPKALAAYQNAMSTSPHAALRRG